MRTVKDVPLIIGALETASQSIEKWLKETGLECWVELLQIVCLLSSGGAPACPQPLR